VIGNDKNSALRKSSSKALRERLIRAGVAELLDPQPRVRAVELRNRSEDGTHALFRRVRIAPDVELHER